MRHPVYTVCSWALAAATFLLVFTWAMPREESFEEITHHTMLEWCMEAFPCDYDVHLEIVSGETESWGWTSWNDELQRYELYVHEDASAETTLHEYAHALDDLENGHGPEFWDIYGDLYQAVIDE